MSYDYITQCNKRENINSIKDRVSAEFYERKYFGNSALSDIRVGNLKIKPATDVYASTPSVMKHPDVKKPSKFKQFLSRIGNSFKNFFRWKEKN